MSKPSILGPFQLDRQTHPDTNQPEHWRSLCAICPFFLPCCWSQAACPPVADGQESATTTVTTNPTTVSAGGGLTATVQANSGSVSPAHPLTRPTGTIISM